MQLYFLLQLGCLRGNANSHWYRKYVSSETHYTDHLLTTHDDSVILICRIYAIYACNKTLLYSLWALLVVQIMAETIVLAPIVAKMRGARRVLAFIAITHRLWF